MSKLLLKTVMASAIAATVAIQTTHASIVTTEQALLYAQKAPKTNVEKERLKALIEKKEVAQKLQAMGIDPKEAAQRVASLTDEEIKRLNDRFDSIPAGGSSALGIVAVIFIVLIITDILGYTKVFTFTKSVNY